MDIKELLRGKHDCPCGRDHSCDIKQVIIENGAVEKLGQICSDYGNIVLVADKNTYATCGERVCALLGDKIEVRQIFESDGFLVPDEAAIAALTGCVKSRTDLILGIGSGVINDLCKYVSFKSGLPYFIIATAPSMDGYASSGAAMITGGMKTTFSAHVPAAIIGDVDILKNAPMDMIKSGFGDIIGKYSALCDWKLASVVNGEYICDYVYNLTYKTMEETKNLAGGILRRDNRTIRTLMEALVIVGIAMSFAGNSRPASGSEHHLSHFFEITGLLENHEYLLHGIDVVFSTVQTQLLREQILGLDKMPQSTYEFDRERWEKEIRENYSSAADGVIALQDKMGYYAQDFKSVYSQRWKEIMRVLKEVPSSAELMQILNTVDLDYDYFINFYGRQKIRSAVWFAKDLKDRYTVLWLYFTLFYK